MRTKKLERLIRQLAQALHLPSHRSNGLRRFGGTWSHEEADEFDRNVAFLHEIDQQMWD